MILSAVMHISNQPQIITDNPLGVILAPTSEIAEQIRQIAHDICDNLGINCAILVEKRNKNDENERQSDKHNHRLLVTTPEFLYEMLRIKTINLTKCSYFVLYDANRMIDMCLDEEVIQISTQIRPDSQRIIWTTSCGSELKDLAMNILSDFIQLNIGSEAVKINIAQNVKQIVKICDDMAKNEILYEIFDTLESNQTICNSLIFTETPEVADKVVKKLRKKGYYGKSLHNRKSPQKRIEILSDFQNGDIQFLALTDIAAKNVIFERITNVIHYDMPIFITDYVNRINRTGRSNGIGTSFAIVTENDGHLADDLISILQQTNQTIDPSLFILKAANADSDDEISFAIPKGKGYQKYTIDNSDK